MKQEGTRAVSSQECILNAKKCSQSLPQPMGWNLLNFELAHDSIGSFRTHPALEFRNSTILVPASMTSTDNEMPQLSRDDATQKDEPYPFPIDMVE